eukprot:1157856-Rhodomonas_salina.1
MTLGSTPTTHTPARIHATRMTLRKNTTRNTHTNRRTDHPTHSSAHPHHPHHPHSPASALARERASSTRTAARQWIRWVTARIRWATARTRWSRSGEESDLVELHGHRAKRPEHLCRLVRRPACRTCSESVNFLRAPRQSTSCRGTRPTHTEKDNAEKKGREFRSVSCSISAALSTFCSANLSTFQHTHA